MHGTCRALESRLFVGITELGSFFLVLASTSHGNSKNTLRQHPFAQSTLSQTQEQKRRTSESKKMSEYYLVTKKPFAEWTPQELADYLKTKADVKDYAEMFMNENVSGKVAHRLTDGDLKDMGVSKVGDRHNLMAALETLKRHKDQQDREKVIWQGTEVMYWSCWDRAVSTCCGCCRDDPQEYKLRYNSLEIKVPEPNRCCCCFKCCWGHSYTIDNIDLSNVQDADVEGIPPPCFHQCCCGGKMQEHVKIQTSNEGEKVLKLYEGQEVARLIKNQVEKMQMMERN
jgi:SAM domain (Sterile alpha motif)